MTMTMTTIHLENRHHHLDFLGRTIWPYGQVVAVGPADLYDGETLWSRPYLKFDSGWTYFPEFTDDGCWGPPQQVPALWVFEAHL